MASKTQTFSPACIFSLSEVGCPAPTPKHCCSFQIDVTGDGSTVLYGSKQQVVVRNLSDPSKSKLVAGHNDIVSVARVAPNGNWVASADEFGKCRIWALKRDDNMLKIEKECFPVRDLAWGASSKKIVIGGRCSGNKVAVFSWDTGAEVGKCGGHTKAVNSVDFKQTRPFRVASGAEDFKINMYKGPPFEHMKAERTKNFVNCVRFSPDGKLLCAVTANKQVLFLDGKTNELQKSTLDEKHTGMVLCCAWSPDSAMIFTGSTDKTGRVHTVNDGKTVAVLRATSGEPQGQHIVQATAFAGKSLLGVTAGGDICDWGPVDSAAAKPQSPKIYAGHQAAVTTVATCSDGTVLSGDGDGAIIMWTKAGVGQRLTGTADKADARLFHKGAVIGIGFTAGGAVTTVGKDQMCRTFKLETPDSVEEFNLGGTPVAFSTATAVDRSVAVLSSGKAVVIQGGKVVGGGPQSLKKNCAEGAALSPDGATLAVGVAKSTNVHLYSVGTDGKLKYKAEIELDEHRASSIAFSPSGKYIAIGDSNGEVKVWDESELGEALIEEYWTYHKSKVTAIAWASTSDALCSVSLDRNMAMWFMGNKRKKVCQPTVHFMGATAVQFIPGTTKVVTGGADNAVKWWNAEVPKKGDDDEESEEE